MRQYCAFDIEIARQLSDFDNWRSHRPLGITCAATLTSSGEMRLWYGKTPSDNPAACMTREEAASLLEHLQSMVQAGYTLLTWNGLGFDFDILGEESKNVAACSQLALDHVDMMFHIFCLRGHTLGLEKAARGMGVPGKSAGMSGALAPRYWAEGRYQEVLEYVAQDVRVTLSVCQAVENQKILKWFSNSGNIQRVAMPHGWLTVKDALQLPLPDVRGFSRPLQRSSFTAWLSA
ncbi:MAG: hypothetical protein HPY45_12175 [Anaerolineae bacterium]|nr:hypothetical protein [Anaerolineae bacterium]